MGARNALRRWQLTWQICRLASHALRRAKAARPGSKERLIFTGMYAGVLDAANAIQVGSWELARRRYPQPPAAPTETTEIYSYLAGYLSGHAATTLADAANRRGENPSSEHRRRLISLYATLVADPAVQQKLLVPSDESVLSLHHFLCSTLAKDGDSVDWQTELDLFRWLIARSGLKTGTSLEERLFRQRRLRQENTNRPAA